jgi:hypothetical protein
VGLWNKTTGSIGLIEADLVSPKARIFSILLARR